MENIVISSDSGLNPIDKKYMIPGLIVDRKGNTFYDQISLEKDTKVLSMEEMFRNMESGEVYQTSAPKYIDYLNTFEKLLQAKKEVLHLTISEYVSSSSYNISMKLIKELQEKYQGKIEIVDSKTAGSGGTILTSYAQELLKEKMNLLEMKEKLEIVRNKVIGSHFVSSCKGYVRSGRVPDSFTLADFLGLRYRVDSNKEGKLVPKKIYRGKIETQAMKYVKDLVNEENIEEYNDFAIALLHMPLKEINYKKIVDYLKSFHYFKKIIESPFYGTISAYGVQDQIGLGLIKK